MIEPPAGHCNAPVEFAKLTSELARQLAERFGLRLPVVLAAFNLPIPGAVDCSRRAKRLGNFDEAWTAWMASRDTDEIRDIILARCLALSSTVAQALSVLRASPDGAVRRSAIRRLGWLMLREAEVTAG